MQRSTPAYLSFFVAYPPVELFAFQADEVISRLQDAALCRDGPSCIDVIPRHHPHRNARALAFPDSFWDLGESGTTTEEEMQVIFAYHGGH